MKIADCKWALAFTALILGIDGAPARAAEAAGGQAAATPSPAVATATGSASKDAAPAKEGSSAPPTFSAPKLSGLLQVWVLAGNEGVNDTFRIRRAELKAVGQVGPKVRWTVMIDPSKALSVNKTSDDVDGEQVLTDVSVNQAGRVLQDAYLSFMPAGKVQIDVGQLKVPMGLEGLQSSAALETVERSLFASDRARGGNFGDIRDLGAVVRLSPGAGVQLIAGAYNGLGESLNDLDKNEEKAVAGKIAWEPPAVPGFHIGAWTAAESASAGDRPRRERSGSELQYMHGGLTLRGELVFGKDGAADRQGYYGLAAYKLRPNLEAVARLDGWDPDTGHETTAATVRERDLLVGFNYYLDGNKAKFQINYVNKSFSGAALADRHLVLVNAQTSW